MHIRVGLLLAAIAPLAATPATAQNPKTAEARPLFNGKDLAGWEHVGPGRMVVEDGLIRTEGGMGLLWYSREKLGDCVVRIVYKPTEKKSNSGVFIRIAEKPKDEWYAVHHGYEVQICDEADEYHCTGTIYSFTKAPPRSAKAGEWRTMEITLKGDRVLVTVDGEKVTDFDPDAPPPPRTKDYEPERGPRPTAGYIGLQNHDDASVVYFKEVSVRPLP